MITRILLPFLVLMVLSTAGFTQKNRLNKKDSTLILEARYFSYSLDTTEQTQMSTMLPFQGIVFKDVRYDTSFIAINWQTNATAMSADKIWNKKYTLDSGVAASFNKYINHYYRSHFTQNNSELVCYLKKFSLKLKDTLLYTHDSHERISNISFEAECYLRTNDSLRPAFRIDTFYTAAVYKIKQTFPELVKNIVSPMLQKLERMDTVRILQRKAYTSQQIEDRYESRFSYPVLTDSVYKRGVYKNFDEFKNNTPSVTDFSIKTKGRSALLFDKDQNIINVLHTFGFCDGQKLWIQTGAFCYPLIRVGNGFEFNLLITVLDSNGYPVTYRILLPLNMDDGKVDEFKTYGTK